MRSGYFLTFFSYTLRTYSYVYLYSKSNGERNLAGDIYLNALTYLDLDISRGMMVSKQEYHTTVCKFDSYSAA